MKKSITIDGVEKKIGDELYFPFNREICERIVTILKIGSKYITVKEGCWETQFSVDDFHEKVNCGLSRRIFSSRDSWLEFLRQKKLVDDVYKHFTGCCNKRISFEQAEAILKILGM